MRCGRTVNRLSCWKNIECDIARASGCAFHIARRTEVRGGCINSTWRIEGSGRHYFVKINAADFAGRFALEAAGLAELAAAAAVRVPQVICAGSNSDASWLVLEHLRLRLRDASSDAALGKQLAALHRHTGSVYGWPRGPLNSERARRNAPAAQWTVFWRDHRLQYQLDLALGNGYGGTLQTAGRKLLERVAALLEGHDPAPSLLHGDLWSGNAAADENGAPVIFDPAAYYGDRETDIAMTELFGGFSASFYAAYRAAYPLDDGYRVRKDLYNLWHVLNHLNLFGGGYLRQAERLIERLLAA